MGKAIKKKVFRKAKNGKDLTHDAAIQKKLLQYKRLGIGPVNFGLAGCFTMESFLPFFEDSRYGAQIGRSLHDLHVWLMPAEDVSAKVGCSGDFDISAGGLALMILVQGGLSVTVWPPMMRGNR